MGHPRSQLDKTQKENFQPVDGEEVLGKIRGFELSSWNFIGHDPKKFRHYAPMAQDFFAAFGHDGLGQIGSKTTIVVTKVVTKGQVLYLVSRLFANRLTVA